MSTQLTAVRNYYVESGARNSTILAACRTAPQSGDLFDSLVALGLVLEAETNPISGELNRGMVSEQRIARFEDAVLAETSDEEEEYDDSEY